MEEVEFNMISNEIIIIGDRIIDSDDIFKLCKRIENLKDVKFVHIILECLYNMPVKTGIYCTLLSLLSKNNNMIKKEVISKLNDIEIHIKENKLFCLFWFRIIIGLSSCYFFDFNYCLKLFENLYELCNNMYNEKEYIKADNILYMFLSNFFFISKQIYYEYKEKLNDILNKCFDLIDKRQIIMNNIDMDYKENETIQYIYIFTKSIIHTNNFYDRLYYLKIALQKYIQNDLKSISTHRFYQKEIFQKIFLNGSNILNINENYHKKLNSEEINETENINTNQNEIKDNKIMFSTNQINTINETDNTSNEFNEEMKKILENCMNIQHFKKFETNKSIKSLQFLFKKRNESNENFHDIWIMQEYVLHLIKLYKKDLDICSKILGIYVQLQFDLYDDILIECIINKLLSTFNINKYYLYISLIQKLLQIKKKLVLVLMKYIKEILKIVGTLDNHSYNMFMELCLYLLSYFIYEKKEEKKKEMFLKRKYNDFNDSNNIINFKKNELSNEKTENNIKEIFDTNEMNKKKKYKVVLRKNDDSINEINKNNIENKSMNNKFDNNNNNNNNNEFNINNQLKENTNEEKNNENKLNNDKISLCKDENQISKNIDNENEDHDNENNDDEFDFSIFKKEIESLKLEENLQNFTLIIFNVKKEYRTKWIRNMYFRSYSLIYKDEIRFYVPNTIINYSKKFESKKKNINENYEIFEYLIFINILKYCIDLIENIEIQILSDIIKEDDIENSKKIFQNKINILINSFINFLNGKRRLNKIPNYFLDLNKNIELLVNVSFDKINDNFYKHYILDSDFFESSVCWNKNQLMILFFKALISFDNSNISRLENIFYINSSIILDFKNSMENEYEKKNFELELLDIIFNLFVNSFTLSILVNLLIKYNLIDEHCVMEYIFTKMDEINIDDYYSIRVIYEIINNLIEKKKSNLEKIKRLKKIQKQDEHETEIKELEENKNQLIKKIFNLTNETIKLFSEKVMKLRKENNTYMSNELLKELLVFIRAYLDYIDMDNFLQLCHEKKFDSDLEELAVVFKYASLKRENKKE